ncbi:MAG: DUF3987 domain-containing protein [Dehalococcoidia bacterium]
MIRGSDLINIAEEESLIARSSNGNGHHEEIDLDAPLDVTWPNPIAEEGFHGVTGEITRAIDPQTEADPAATLLTTLVFAGNYIGPNVYARVTEDCHPGKVNVVFCGQSGKARKGLSAGPVKEAYERAEEVDRSESWARNCIKGGLSSGEGLIWAVRDPIFKRQEIIDGKRRTGEYEDVMVDPGVEDKRLLALETEFASVLKVLAREGSTLSPLIRQAWDTGELQSLTKNSPAHATGAHISIIGHVTIRELRKYLAETEAANGFGNRFLWVCVKRSKLLPEGGDGIPYQEIVPKLHDALKQAQVIRGLGKPLFRDDAARREWAAIYEELSEGQAGLVGDVTNRAEAQVLRLSVIYAALDGSEVIRPEHQRAALAVWEYCENSARYIFQDRTGNELGDKILDALTNGPMSGTEINNSLGTHVKAIQIRDALKILVELGRVRSEQEKGKGRPTTIWHRV